MVVVSFVPPFEVANAITLHPYTKPSSLIAEILLLLLENTTKQIKAKLAICALCDSMKYYWCCWIIQKYRAKLPLPLPPFPISQKYCCCCQRTQQNRAKLPLPLLTSPISENCCYTIKQSKATFATATFPDSPKYCYSCWVKQKAKLSHPRHCYSPQSSKILLLLLNNSKTEQSCHCCCFRHQ